LQPPLQLQAQVTAVADTPRTSQPSLAQPPRLAS
jgi:hypothetical protein